MIRTLLTLLTGLSILWCACGRESTPVAYPEGNGGTNTNSDLNDSANEDLFPSDQDLLKDENQIDPNADAIPTNTNVPCQGLQAHGGCWYLAPEEQSCTALCRNLGGYNPATDHIAGNGGSDQQCKEIAAALIGPLQKSGGEMIWEGFQQALLPGFAVDVFENVQYEVKDVRQDFQGNPDDLQFAYSPGCTAHRGPNGDYALVIRHVGVKTNPDDKAFGTNRVCACGR